MSTKATDPVFLADVAAEFGYTRGHTLARAINRAGFRTFFAQKPHKKPARAINPGDLAAFRRINSSIVRVEDAPASRHSRG